MLDFKHGKYDKTTKMKDNGEKKKPVKYFDLRSNRGCNLIEEKNKLTLYLFLLK